MPMQCFGTPIPQQVYHHREGAYLIALESGKVAVVQTHKGFFLPGGGCESGETHFTCIQRECLEETGYQVVIGDFICSAEAYILHPTIGHFHPIQHYYGGSFVKKIAPATELDHSLMWLPLDEVLEKMYLPFQSWAIEQCYYNTNQK